MMKSTPLLHFDGRAHGVDVRPDQAVIPVQIDVWAASPGQLPDAVVGLQARISSAIPEGATLALAGYRSWTEKLAKTGLFGHGTRYAARATGSVQLSLPDDAGFLARTQAVEAVRSTLEALSGEAATGIRVGECTFRLSDPEAHRPSALANLKRRLDATCAAFGLAVHELQLGSELAIEVTGPMRAWVRLDATATLRRDALVPAS